MDDRREYELQEAIRRAVLAADHVILEASDGSTEETNYLTARVAEEFVKKAMLPHWQVLLARREEPKE